MHINEQIWIELNGARQYLSIRAEREQAPLLLYLHGGPGDAALPLVLRYNQALERRYTVVVWEQRGAGKSFYKFEPGAVTIETFMQDVHALTTYLLERFGQERLFLVGHSWGSVLGLAYTGRHPERIQRYIGCGQVVHMKQSCRVAYEYALAHADPRALERLRGIDCAYTGENWLDDLLYVTKQVVRHGGSLYGSRNYNRLVLPFLFSTTYSIPDLVRRQRGSLQAIQCLWQELMQVNFEERTRYGAPIVFIEGRQDRHVSSELAESYFNRIETDKQFHWFERSCHFPQWSESERFNACLLQLLD